MTGAGRYAELAAAVRSFKAQFVRPIEIERLVETGSLSETVSLLTSGKVTSTDGSDITTVESYLTQNAVELAERLAAYAPHDSRALIKLFATKYELECVKEILRSIADQIEPDEAMKHIVPVGKFTAERCKELIEARNPNRVIETLEDEGLKRFLVPKLAGEKRGIAAVSAIDQYYYDRLWAASNLPDPLDAQSARGLIGALIDHLNILLALRGRLMGLDARATADLLIPVNYGLGHALTELTESTNLQNLMRAIEKTPYAQAFKGPAALDSSGSGIERALNRSHASSCLNSFAGSPFNIGLALAFLFLKNYELRDLFAIINGKANNVPAERVTESLILNPK
jgi:V/A-type H+-transporting ATPase subunit C